MQAPVSRPSYFAHVDGLRALAVVAVMVYHLDPALLPGGFVGVDVFFVISGFVVTASLAGHQSETVGSFLARFYARRLARLMPALVTMLIVTTLLYVLFVPQAWFNRASESVGQWAFWGLSNWTLDQQVVNYFEPRAELNPFTHTWSLAVEEQFYLLVPLLLYFALGQRLEASTRRAVVAAIAALAVLSLIACLYIGVTKGSRHVFYLLTFRFWELAAGVLLFLVGTKITRLPARIAGLYRYSAPIGVLLIMVAMALPRPQAYPYLRSVLAVTGAILTIGLPAIARIGVVPRVLSHRSVLWVGHRSYALYLWHWPVYVLARWTTGLTHWPFNVLAVALSFGLAAASFRLIENPIRFSRMLARRSPAVRIGIFVAIMSVGWTAGNALHANQPRLGLGQTARHAADWYPDNGLLARSLASRRICEPTEHKLPLGPRPEGITLFSPEACKVAQPTPPALFALGDSHVVAYKPMLEQIAAEQGRSVTALHVPGCAYVNMLAPMSSATDAACDTAARDAMAAVLQRAKPGDIVFLVSLRLPRLIELGGKPRPLTPQGQYMLAGSEQASIGAAAVDARRWIRPFTEAGLRVIIELPKPVFRSHAFQCVDWFNRGNPDCSGGLSEPRVMQDRYRAPVVAAITDLAGNLPGMFVWDPLPALCDGPSCTAIRDGRPLYFDGDHVSPYGNQVLLAHFLDALRDVQKQGVRDAHPGP